MKTFISLIVLLLAALVTWWSVSGRNTLTAPAPASGKPFLTAFINDFRLLSVGARGRTEYTLSGKRLERYSQSDEARIERPVFHFLGEEKLWEITADTARLDEKQQHIFLQGHVVMKQPQQPAGLRVHAPAMQIDTRARTARTHSGVRMLRGGAQIRSRDMVFYEAEQRLELDHQVTGLYRQPRNHHPRPRKNRNATP